MDLYTQFKPGDVAYQIRYVDDHKTRVSTEEPCPICSGTGVIDSIFTCGKCDGKKLCNIYTWEPVPPYYKMIGAVSVVAVSVSCDMTERVDSKFLDASLHAQVDRLHKGYGVDLHSTRPEDLYWNEQDVNTLNSGIFPPRPQVKRAETKFNSGDTIFALLHYVEASENCPKCGGVGVKQSGGYTHRCSTCSGEGTVVHNSPRYEIVSGKIGGVHWFIMNPTGNIISYSCDCNGMFEVFPEEVLATTEKEAIKIARHFKFGRRIVKGALSKPQHEHCRVPC